MNDWQVSRRTALRTGAGGVSLAALSGLAGCSGIIPGTGGGNSDYADWVAEPGTYSDREYIGFTYVEPASLSEDEDELGDAYDGYEESLAGARVRAATDVDFDEVDTAISFSPVSVLEADYDREDVADELEDNGFDDETDHEGYTIYLNEDETYAVGIDGSTVVGSAGSPDEDPDEAVELAVDTANGEEDRYVDAEEDFAELVDAVGTGTVVSGGLTEEIGETRAESGRFEGVVGFASKLEVDGETTTTTELYLYDDEDDPDEGDVEDYVDDGGTYDDHDETEISVDGRIVEITGDVDTDDWFGDASGATDDLPSDAESEGGAGVIQAWAFDPGAVADQDSYRATYRDFGAIRENEDEFDDEFFDRVEDQYDQQYGELLDIDFGDADWSLGLGQARVLSADHTVGDVVDHLETEFDYEEADSVSGYTTLLGPNERRAVAADGSLVLAVRVGQDAASALEALVDTQTGGTDMWVDEDQDFAAAVGSVDGDVVSAGSDGFAQGVVATSNSATFDGETTQQRFVRVYDEEDDYDQDDIQDQVDEEEDLTVTFQGRVVVIEGQTDTDEYGVS